MLLNEVEKLINTGHGLEEWDIVIFTTNCFSRKQWSNIEDKTNWRVIEINTIDKNISVELINPDNLVKCAMSGCETPYDTLVYCAECGDIFCIHHARRRQELCYDDQTTNGDYPVDKNNKYLCGKTAQEHDLSTERFCDECADSWSH